MVLLAVFQTKPARSQPPPDAAPPAALPFEPALAPLLPATASEPAWPALAALLAPAPLAPALLAPPLATDADPARFASLPAADIRPALLSPAPLLPAVFGAPLPPETEAAQPAPGSMASKNEQVTALMAADGLRSID